MSGGIFDEYLEAKYANGGPDGGRFESDDDEIHTSQVGQCRRRFWHERRNPRPDEASPYFELGRVFEELYGAALAWRHGDLSADQLQSNEPWDLPGLCPRIEQDVNIRIQIAGDLTIPGEADWCVYREDMLDEVEARGGVDLVELATGDLGDGERRVTFGDGHQLVLEPGEPTAVERVIETKTIKDLSILGGSPKDSHLHQLYGYMVALNAPGEWAYMVRDDLTTARFRQELDETLQMEVEMQARRKRKDLRDKEAWRDVPVSPANKWSCCWCPLKEECDESLM